jgi:hypothetical protein
MVPAGGATAGGGVAGNLGGAGGPDAGKAGSRYSGAGGDNGSEAVDAARQSMTARRSMTTESGMAKTAKTIAARPWKTEQRGGARPFPPVHTAAPLHCAASWSFLLVV